MTQGVDGVLGAGYDDRVGLRGHRKARGQAERAADDGRADDADGLVAWLAPGTPLIKPVLTDGRETRQAGPVAMFTADRVLKLDVWHGTGILKVSPPGQAVVRLALLGRGRDLPRVVREPRGVSMCATGLPGVPALVDHVLDLWINPDRSIEWKDEDELEGAVAAGRFTAAEAERIVADAHAAIRDIEAWTSPFSDDWQSWSAPPDWRLPVAPTTHQPDLIAEELHSA